METLISLSVTRTSKFKRIQLHCNMAEQCGIKELSCANRRKQHTRIKCNYKFSHPLKHKTEYLCPPRRSASKDPLPSLHRASAPLREILFFFRKAGKLSILEHLFFIYILSGILIWSALGAALVALAPKMEDCLPE